VSTTALTHTQQSPAASPPPSRWVHTDIQAPHTFTVTGFNMLETGRGVAYSAQLIHPTLGAVGLISNEGCGGPTMFHTNDFARYSERDLTAFLSGCLQDGQPMDRGSMGLETLLDEIINEAEYAEDVDRMRREGQFLVRAYEPRTDSNYGSHRGPSLPFARLALRRDARERLAAKLAANPEHRLQPGQTWQMFTGVDWAPLLGEPILSAEQTTARLQAVTDLLTRSPEASFVLGVRLDEEFVVFGSPASGRFTLVGDTTMTVETTRWCRCERRLADVPFQRWDNHGLLESGTVHSAKRCRRLVSID
jgi:hypothetical protein